jgi:hypothetical protein
MARQPASHKGRQLKLLAFYLFGDKKINLNKYAVVAALKGEGWILLVAGFNQ